MCMKRTGRHALVLVRAKALVFGWKPGACQECFCICTRAQTATSSSCLKHLTAPPVQSKIGKRSAMTQS